MRRTIVAAAAAAALAGAGCASVRAAWQSVRGGGAEGTRETGTAMVEIADALRVVLPLSLSAERFSAPENQAALSSSLAALRAGAHELESHGRSQDASFAYLSRSLARDAEEIKRRFDGGRLDETRFLLGALVEDCVDCHSRLPGEGDSARGRSLFEALDTSQLTPLEQARLALATGQSEAALERYEELLRDPAASPADLDLDGVLSDALAVAIRVREDLPRAKRMLEAFAARPDVPAYLATLVARWIAACDSLQDSIGGERSLSEAERVLDEGELLSRRGRSRAGLVHQLVASHLLLEYVASRPELPRDAAHAYFLLGVTELRSGVEAEAYLEAAIRTAPGSDWAKRSYVLLEEQTLASYSGSGGVHVPPEVRQRLKELQRIAVGTEG
jgi:hypothetical protein